jgi:hypothetical protein
MNFKRSILIFGQQADPHVSEVKRHLQNKSHTVKVCNLYKEHNFNLTFHYGDIYVDGELINNFDLIWWRFKGLFEDKNSPDIINFDSEQKRSFWYSQWMTMCNYIIANKKLFPKQINPFIPLGDNKLEQLFYAEKVGLKTPKTVVTNSADDVLTNIKRDKILIKPLNGVSYSSGKFIFAHVFSRHEIEQQKCSISLCPAMFQEYIEKEYEIRSFVFGRNIFSVKIASQKKADSKVDWRVNTFDEKMFEPYNLSESEQTLLENYLSQCGMPYGVFDLIRHPSGSLYFLECNPEGQWLFLEQATKLPMTERFADFILLRSSDN